MPADQFAIHGITAKSALCKPEEGISKDNCDGAWEVRTKDDRCFLALVAAKPLPDDSSLWKVGVLWYKRQEPSRRWLRALNRLWTRTGSGGALSKQAALSIESILLQQGARVRRRRAEP